MDKINEFQLNSVRLPIVIDNKSDSDNDHLKYSNQRTKLTFNHRYLQCSSELNTKHSNTMTTPFLANNTINEHRTHLKRRPKKCKIKRILHTNHHQSHSSYEFSQSTIDNSSTKFSCIQHNKQFSRFYMIFVIILIFLLNKINCDQGTVTIFYDNRYSILFFCIISFVVKRKIMFFLSSF